MTKVQRGSIVRSTAGRDQDKLYLVWQNEDDFLLLVDGDKRRLCKPKRKRHKHFSVLAMLEEKDFEDILAGLGDGSADCRIRRKLRQYKRNETDEINE